MPKIVSSGKALHSSEFHTKKQKEKRKRYLFIIFLVVLVFAAPIFILRTDRFKIHSIGVIGNEILRSDEVVGIIEEEIADSYFLIVPKSSSPVYPRRGIEKALLSKIPRIKSIDISRENLRSLSITIVERDPVALYCQKVENIKNYSGCYFMDEEGFIFASAPLFSGDVYFIFGDETSTFSPEGQLFLPEEEFQSIRNFIKDMEKLGVYPKVFKITPGSIGLSEKYNLILSNAVRIFWNAEEDIDLIRSNLETLMSSEIIGDKDKFLNSIEYIDLTVPNKAYWLPIN